MTNKCSVTIIILHKALKVNTKEKKQVLDSLQNNQIARKIDVTDKKAEYDENVKWLLSEKLILLSDELLPA